MPEREVAGYCGGEWLYYLITNFLGVHNSNLYAFGMAILGCQFDCLKSTEV